MKENICFYICIVATIIFILIAFSALFIFKIKKIRANLKFRLLISGVILIAADIFLFYAIAEQNYLSKSFFLFLINALKMITLNLDYKCIYEIVNSEKPIFDLFMALSILTPLFWSFGLLFFISEVNNFVRYHLYKLFTCRAICFFSELNENSFSMAKDLSTNKDDSNKKRKTFDGKKQKKYLCVFCGVSKYENKELYNLAEMEGFILFSKPMGRYIKRTKTKKEWIYFGISQNQNNNLREIKEVLNNYDKKKKTNKDLPVRFYLYTEEKEAPLDLSTSRKNFKVTIINRNRYIANDLIFRHPITEALRFGDKDIKALVIGAGKVGTEIIKNILWSGQLGKEHKLSITVFDKNATSIKNHFYTENQELNKLYRLSFIQTNIFDTTFKSKIEKTTGKTNYICICLGDDELNIQVALFLRRYYMRNGFSDNNPFIAIETKNDIKAASVLEFYDIDKKNDLNGKNEKYLLEKQNLKYHFHSFGQNTTIYTRIIIENELEELAKNIHFHYEKVRSLLIGGGTPSKETTNQSYYMSDFNMRSARARALHIASKLYLQKLSFDFTNTYENQKERYLAIHEKAEEELKNNLNMYSKIEHDRWVAFMRCEGWIKGDEKIIKLEKDLYRRTREKMHYCIQSSEELEKQNLFGNKFKNYDEEIALSTMEVIRETLNITGDDK